MLNEFTVAESTNQDILKEDCASIHLKCCSDLWALALDINGLQKRAIENPDSPYWAAFKQQLHDIEKVATTISELASDAQNRVFDIEHETL